MSDAETSPTRSSKNSLRKTEWMLAGTIVCMLAVVAVPTIRSTPQEHIVVGSVQDLEKLITLARDEAIATGDLHIVYFESDSTGAQITDDQGTPVLALLARDLDQNGFASASEYVASVPLDPSGGVVGWGTAVANRPANGDSARWLTGPWSFTEPGGRTPARWLLFPPDGMPRAFSAESRLMGPPGSGAGTVYTYSASDDYAVVLSAWGDVEVQHWNADASRWKLASAR